MTVRRRRVFNRTKDGTAVKLMAVFSRGREAVELRESAGGGPFIPASQQHKLFPSRWLSQESRDRLFALAGAVTPTVHHKMDVCGMGTEP